MTSKLGFFDFAGQKARQGDLLRRSDWKEIATFIGPNAETFRSTWNRMGERAEDGRSTWVWGYCWPALILGFAWYFYRKLWGAGLFILVVPIVAGVISGSGILSFAVMIAIAMYARSYYISHALRRIEEVRSHGGSSRALAEAGGISVAGGIVGGILFAASAAATLASLFMSLAR